MKQLTFVKPAAMKLGESFTSDHNRDPVSISFERIENRQRTQLGTLRSYFRADKRTFSTSWSDLPGTSADTVDGNMGAKDMEAFFLANTGALTLTITYDTGVDETFTVLLSDFSIELVKRWNTVELYNADITLEEV